MRVAGTKQGPDGDQTLPVIKERSLESTDVVQEKVVQRALTELFLDGDKTLIRLDLAFRKSCRRALTALKKISWPESTKGYIVVGDITSILPNTNNCSKDRLNTTSSANTLAGGGR